MKTILLLLFILCLHPAKAQTNTAQVTRKFKPYVPPVAAPVKLGKPKQIRIVSVDGVLSTYYKCSTSWGSIYLAGLPASVKADHDVMVQAEARPRGARASASTTWKRKFRRFMTTAARPITPMPNCRRIKR